MTITRDPEYPVEAAQLMDAFNKCADGHESLMVLNATIQMLIAAVVFEATSKGCSLEQAEGYVEHLNGLILAGVQENWKCAARPSDVAVKTS
jgi:hypothetical protein